ncbi:hypothetical protein P170DRAFT_404134 [Aspergillus steynii IBT 23096]|uniref:Uncharacterized protein n=1 Tax=Aspergillus steynii IBT 23096 TaxID=1392250 RepID=A0A2I2GJZ2_9EURO|nr:uncharacterized protein P170DRAFT_404134 [Aspergillus steynii IBT 23096]PLB53206.1 hypothetical protein P170DRAFT_404134 [Aspergillus steynii IBT 23096]
MTTTGKTKPLKAPTDRSNDDEDFADQNQDIKADSPTDSHFLSQVEQDEKGLAQKAGATQDVSDVGWGQSRDEFEERIVSSLSNEDLWMLIRRFNKQIYYVKALPEAPLQNLDLIRSEDEQFSPDKLRATMERFYTTIVVAAASSVKHIARLRSWKETRRTSAFCAVYFVAWLLDLLAPTFFCFLLALAVYPPCRAMLFPPAPIALVDMNTGGVQKPSANVLGSHDSITGAPEKLKGEAAEQEASNMITSVASVAVGSIAGKHDQATPEDAPLEASVPDATDIISDTADAQATAHGEVPADSHDKTRQPMKETVLNGANQLMRILSDVIDTYEKIGNALSPTSPFPVFRPYVRFATVLTSAILVSLVTSSYLFVKGGTFIVGFAFFGDPVFWRVTAYLDRKYPGWKHLLQLQNSLLKGVPTNAQLTITLLRIGEANAAPLPPPPDHSQTKAPSHPASIHAEDLTLGASTEEIHQAASPSAPAPSALTPSAPTPSAPKPAHPPKPQKPWISSIIGFFRGTTATGIQSKLAVDRVRAAVGSGHAKTRIGILHRKGVSTSPSGPVEFDARYKGKRGALVIDSSLDPAVLYFTTDDTAQLDPRLSSRGKGAVLFTIPVTEIQEMRKIGGLGWKGKLVAGWAMGSKEVVDGLVIVGREAKTYRLTAMRMRNQLFNRLVAIDGQVWECL